MKNNKKNQNIFYRNKLLAIMTGLLLFLVFLTIIINQSTILKLTTYKDSYPKKVRITNITERSATISWYTDSKEIGMVAVKELKEGRISDFDILFNSKNLSYYYDDRDVALAELNSKDSLVEKEDNLFYGEKGKYYTHHVTISGLNPLTSYEFQIGNSYVFWDYEEALQETVWYEVPVTDRFSFLTLQDNINMLEVPNPSYGNVKYVLESNEKTDASDSLIFINLYEVDEAGDLSSEPMAGFLSAPTNNMGGWAIDKSNFRDESGAVVKDYSEGIDKLGLYLQFQNLEATPINYFVVGIDDTPVPDLEIYESEQVEFSYNYKDLISRVDAASGDPSICCALKIENQDGYIGDFEKPNVGTDCEQIFKKFLEGKPAYGGKVVDAICLHQGGDRPSCEKVWSENKVRDINASLSPTCENTGSADGESDGGSGTSGDADSGGLNSIPNDGIIKDTDGDSNVSDETEIIGPICCGLEAEGESYLYGDYEINSDNKSCEQLFSEYLNGSKKYNGKTIVSVVTISEATSRSQCEVQWSKDSIGSSLKNVERNTEIVKNDGSSEINNTEKQNEVVKNSVETSVGPLCCGIQLRGENIYYGDFESNNSNKSCSELFASYLDGSKNYKNKEVAKVIEIPAISDRTSCEKTWSQSGINNIGKDDVGVTGDSNVENIVKCCVVARADDKSVVAFTQSDDSSCLVAPETMVITEFSSSDYSCRTLNDYLKTNSFGVSVSELHRVFEKRQDINVRCCVYQNAINGTFLKYSAFGDINGNCSEDGSLIEKYTVKGADSWTWDEAIIDKDQERVTDFNSCYKAWPIEIRLDEISNETNSLLKLFNSSQVNADEGNLLINTDSSGNDYVIYFVEEGAYSVSLGEEYSGYVNAIPENPYIFYLEKNGEDGYQAPKDVQNPTSNEDILVPVTGKEISVDKISKNYSIKVQPGFNIISLPFLPSKDGQNVYKVSDLIYDPANSQITGNIKGVARFENGTWSSIYSISVSGEPYGNDFPLSFGKGYMIIMDSNSPRNSVITIPGYDIEESIPVAFKPGWNLVGIHGYSEEFTASSLIDSISEIKVLTADNVTSWSAEKARYEGFQKDLPGEYGFNFNIENDKGYFVRITEFVPEDSSCNSVIWQPGDDLNGKCE